MPLPASGEGSKEMAPFGSGNCYTYHMSLTLQRKFQTIKQIRELFDPALLSEPSFHAALIALWTLLTLSGLLAAPLFDYDEAAHAQAAVEMLRDGKWLLPTMNGQPFYEKPALLFYFMSASFKLFGENAFAARLPSALFTLATALYLWYLGRRIGRPLVGRTASLIYLSMLMPAMLAHAAIFDATLNFCIAVSILSFFLWRQNGRLYDAVLSMLAAGVAVSVKGPVGAVLPLSVIILDRLADRDVTGSLRAFPWKWGIPAFLAGASPWYVLVSVVYGFGFLRQFILVENLYRFTHSMEGHSGGWYYYLLILVPSTLPWFAWLPWWLKQSMHRWKEREELGLISRMSVIWSLSVILIFSISQTKLPHYISSIYPAIALGISAQWHRQAPDRSWVRFSTLILMITGIPLALLLLALPELYSYIAGMATHPRAAAVLNQGVRPDFWISAGGALLLVSLGALLGKSWNSQPLPALARSVLFGLLLQTTLIWSLGPWAGRLLQSQLLDIAAVIRTSPTVLPVYSMVNRPSISFYSRRSYVELKAGGLEQPANSSMPYWFVARTSNLTDISSLPLEVVVRNKEYVLLRKVTSSSSGHDRSWLPFSHGLVEEGETISK